MGRSIGASQHPDRCRNGAWHQDSSCNEHALPGGGHHGPGSKCRDGSRRVEPPCARRSNL